MKKSALIIVCVILVSLIAGMIPASAAAANFVPDMYIVGISMNPPGNNQQHCFIEIYNASDKAIDLKQYKLAMGHPGAAYAPFVYFNEIRQYTSGEIAAGAKEPDQAFIGPGEVAIIWVKGNNNDALKAMTREDFIGPLNANSQGWGIPAANNPKVFVTNEASHAGGDMSGGGDGTPFYLINSDTTNTIPNYFTFYIVEKGATATEYHNRAASKDWDNKVVSYAEITSRDARAHGVFDDAIVKMKYDVAQGKSLYYKTILPAGRAITDEVALSGDTAAARLELGIYMGIVDAEVKLVASSVSAATTAPTTTATPTTTAKPTTTAPVTTSPGTYDSSVYLVVSALMLAAVMVFVISRKRSNSKI